MSSKYDEQDTVLSPKQVDEILTVAGSAAFKVIGERARYREEFDFLVTCLTTDLLDVISREKPDIPEEIKTWARRASDEFQEITLALSKANNETGADDGQVVSSESN